MNHMHLDPLEALNRSLEMPNLNLTPAIPGYYDILDVAPTASRLDIREAYLRLKGTYGGGSAALYSLISDEEARDQMARVEEAFRVLGDDVSRRDYDQAHGLTRFEPPVATAELGHGTERIMRMREQVATNYGAEPRAMPVDVSGGVIRTSRSTLPVLKLKAAAAGSEELANKYQAILGAGDPADGDLFKRLREAAEVTEDEMQDRIKVTIGYLRAIEGNRFERLPQAVYVKGFLRSYFRYLMVPEAEKLVAAFSTRLSDWQTTRKT